MSQLCPARPLAIAGKASSGVVSQQASIKLNWLSNALSVSSIIQKKAETNSALFSKNNQKPSAVSGVIASQDSEPSGEHWRQSPYDLLPIDTREARSRDLAPQMPPQSHLENVL